MKAVFAVLAVVALAACTKAPASIGVKQISDMNYDNLNCEELTAEKTRLSIAHSVAGEEGDGKDQNQEAVNQAMEARGCSPTQAAMKPPQAEQPKTAKPQ